MKKKFMSFTAVAVMLFLGACSNQDEILTENNTEPTRTISIKASMPEGQPTTRIALEEEGKNMNLTWEVGDVLNLLFEQGTIRVQAQVELTQEDISNEGKNAQFEIPVPNGATGEFTLYGVYGGRGIVTSSESDDIAAALPLNPNILANTDQRNIMLYFVTTMQTTDEDVAVTFEHIGSLFNISISNITPSVIASFTGPISELRLIGIEGENNDGMWAYNNPDGQYFDLKSQTLKNLPAAPYGNYISFNREIFDNGTASLWAWYPPMTDKVWPEVKLQIIGLDGTTVLKESTNTKTRTTITEAGKSYYLYASFNEDNELEFVDPF